MKNNCKILSMVLTAFLILAVGCDDDDVSKGPQDMVKTYTLNELNGSGVSGTVTFKKLDTNSTLATIELTGTRSGESHPAHIHSGAAGAGGPIIIDLAAVDGATGKSETTIIMYNNGNIISYEGLLNLDAVVNVHKSKAEIATMICQGNIGINDVKYGD